MSGSVQAIEHRNRNSIPARTHALAFRGGFQDGGERCEVRVNHKRRRCSSRNGDAKKRARERERKKGKVSLLRVITIILTEGTLPLIRALSETHLASRVSSLRDEITNARHDAERTCAYTGANNNMHERSTRENHLLIITRLLMIREI